MAIVTIPAYLGHEFPEGLGAFPFELAILPAQLDFAPFGARLSAIFDRNGIPQCRKRAEISRRNAPY